MLRKWFGPRALLWHFTVIVIVVGCLAAMWWQVHRAMAGNTLSYLYSVEWPIFAVVAVIGWWQLIMEHPSEVEARKEERRRRGRPNPVAFDQELLRREILARPELVKTFPELARAFPELAPGSADRELAGLEGVGSAAPGSLTHVAPSGAVGPPVVDDGDHASPSEELRAYNQALAALASGGKAKSWRNPHGR